MFLTANQNISFDEKLRMFLYRLPLVLRNLKLWMNGFLAYNLKIAKSLPLSCIFTSPAIFSDSTELAIP